MAAPSVLACDWGTTNLRAWTLDETGRVLQHRDFPGCGVAQLGRDEAERRFEDLVRPALDAQDAPAILCGMVGSTLGWTVAPYASCPATLDDLARNLKPVVGTRWVRIVPGVQWGGFNGRGDVMRGEETQLFGWIQQDPARAWGRHVVCHPGTHPKWMLVEDGRLVRFVTAMTGELFAVLRRHSVLKSDAEPDDGPAFAEGLAAAGEGDALAARLFTARARVVGLGEAVDSTPAYLSGLLIGAEVASIPRLLGVEATTVALLGDPALCGLYDQALRGRGVATTRDNGEAAAVMGLFALYQKAKAHEA